jgi:luciferase family oxidoreductase group 1
VPGAGLDVPIWLLGSSVFSAGLAAALGLPFAFASHFAPDLLDEALAIYRGEFQPSDILQRPYAVAAIAVFAADTDEAAKRLFTSLQQSFVRLRRGTPGALPPPVDTMDGLWTPTERAGVEHAFREAVVGSLDTVTRGLATFLRRTRVDELMVTAAIHDHTARLRSFELVAQAREIVNKSS